MLVPAEKIIKGRDGREWKNPVPKQVAHNSNERLPMLPVDENHSTDLSAPNGGSSPAFGWMKNLCADENGAIWADVDWTKRGRDALLNKEYRFISPVFMHSEKGEINCILRAALTNSPNLNLPALNSEQVNNNKLEVPMKKELCAVLGLPETATDDEIIAALKSLAASVKSLNAAQAAAKTQTDKTPVDLAAYAPRADLNAMESRAVAAEKQLAELNAVQLKKDAEALIDEALKNGKIPPANKPEFLSLCATREGFESCKKIVAVNPAIVETKAQAPANAPPGSGSVALNAEDSAFAKAMGYTPEVWAKLKEDGK